MMKSSTKTFWILMVAYTASMVYQYYRSQVGQFPEYDTFGITEIVSYAIFFGWSSLALIQRRWATWSILVLCVLQQLIGVLYYLPVIFIQRHDTFWDWAECIVFIGLIFWAGVRAYQQLREKGTSAYHTKAASTNAGLQRVGATMLLELALISHSIGQPQYAFTVLNFSSEFLPSNDACTNGFAACRIIGEPDVYPNYGDLPGTWSPSTSSTQREYIVVGFAEPMPINTVNIYETFYPGAVDTVYVRNQYDATWHVVWTGTAAYTEPLSRINTITFPMTTFPIDMVRLALNSPLVAGYNQIDAVSISGSTVGVPEVEQLDVMIYPNPSGGRFAVSVPGQQIKKVLIRDVAGRLLREIVSTAGGLLHIDVELPKGIYLLEVMIGDSGTAVVRHVIE